MPPPDGQDDVARQRLLALGLEPRGWVPDQTGYSFDSPPPGPPVAASPPDRSAPGVAPVAVRPSWQPAWLDSVLVAGSNRALVGLAAVCAGCLLVTGWVLLHPRAQAAPPPAPALPVAALPLPTPSPAGIVVDVGGRVRRPGLVTLSPGARVADAIRAAGGVVRASDLALVNLAALVSDGQLLLIGVAGAAPADGGVGGSSGPLNLNTATVDALDGLPGIGPVLAQRIVDWRSAHGSFHSVKDLDQVSGIGPSIYAEISPLVTV